MPVLNESADVGAALLALQPLRERACEIIVVDGGSTDNTVAQASEHSSLVIASKRGRAAQQNAGAKVASGDVLLFLHVDTRLPANANALIDAAMTNHRTLWGRFDVELDSGDLPARRIFKVIATMMNFRSRLTGVATGDQCIFVRKPAFDAIGGFPQIPLMEDIALSKLLKKMSAPACLHQRATTSARRWQKHGIWRTVLLMWWLRFAYWIGVSPERLAAWYR